MNWRAVFNGLMSVAIVVVIALLVALYVGRTTEVKVEPTVQALTYDGPYEDGSGTVSYLLGGKVYRIAYCLPRWPCNVEGP